MEMLKVAAHSSWSALPPVVAFLVSGALAKNGSGTFNEFEY